MKTVTLIVLTAMVAGLAAGWMVASLQAPVVTAPPRDSRALEARVAELEAEVDRWRTARGGLATSHDSTGASVRDPLRQLRGELRDLRARVELPPDSPEGGADRGLREEVSAIVDDRLERIEAERQLRIAERQAKEASRWARAFARKEATRVGERLSLDERQVDRLAAAMEQHRVANAPHYAVVKDEAQAVEARLGAIDAIRVHQSTFEESAREILTWRQYYEYQMMREEEQDKIGVWIDELEAQLVESNENTDSPDG